MQNKKLEELKTSVAFRQKQNQLVMNEYILDKIDTAYRYGYAEGIKAASMAIKKQNERNSDK